MSRPAPDRNIALELVRVTEAGAMGAARWIGRGQKESADGAAVVSGTLPRGATGTVCGGDSGSGDIGAGT